MAIGFDHFNGVSLGKLGASLVDPCRVTLDGEQPMVRERHREVENVPFLP
jgi:hypothetical protein